MAALVLKDAGVLLRRLRRGVDRRLEADHAGEALLVDLVQGDDAFAQPVGAGLLCVELCLHGLGLLAEEAHTLGRQFLLEALARQSVLVVVELAADFLRGEALLLQRGDDPVQARRRQVRLAVRHESGQRLVEGVDVLLRLLHRRAVGAEEADDGLLDLVEALGVDDLLQAVSQPSEVLAEGAGRLAADLP